MRNGLILFFILNCCTIGSSGGEKPRKKGDKSPCQGLTKKQAESLEKRLAQAKKLAQSKDIHDAALCAIGASATGEENWLRAETLFTIAVTAHGMQQSDTALKCMLEIPDELMGTWGQANHLLGVLYLQKGNAPKALDSLDKASRLLPTEPLIYTALAQAHYDIGDPRGAVTVWKRGVHALPQYAEGLFNVGLLLRELGEAAESERSYRAAIRLAPASARYRYSYGNLLYDMGVLDRACDAYR
jgi:tetratricopeptide (TPR) repeat protein